jgi:hypothetical protein
MSRWKHSSAWPSLAKKAGVLWDLRGLTKKRSAGFPTRQSQAGKETCPPPEIPENQGWFYDEFGQIVSAMMRKGSFMADFRGILRKFDDCPDHYEYVSLNRGGDKVARPYLALLASLTSADLRPYARKHAALWNDGFWARFAFVCPLANLQPARGHFPEGKRHIPRQIVEPLRDWHQSLGVPAVTLEADADGIMRVSSDAPQVQCCTQGTDVLDAFNRYNDTLVTMVSASRTQDLDGNKARLAEKALRVAMLLASMGNEGRIEIAHWARAQQIAEMWRQNLHHLYYQVSSATGVESHTRNYEEAILRMIAEKGPRTKREIYKNTWGLDSHQAGIILKSLEEAEMIVGVPTAQTIRYQLVK